MLIVPSACSSFASEVEFIMFMVPMLYGKNIFLYFILLANQKHHSQFELKKTDFSARQKFQRASKFFSKWVWNLILVYFCKLCKFKVEKLLCQFAEKKPQSLVEGIAEGEPEYDPHIIPIFGLFEPCVSYKRNFYEKNHCMQFVESS